MHQIHKHSSKTSYNRSTYAMLKRSVLELMSEWCMAWGMKVNVKKSQFMHHRNHQRPRCKKPLHLCNAELEYVENYKYLGCWVNEFGRDNKTVDGLTAAAGRSFGRIIDNFRKIGDLGHRSFSSLYEASALPIDNYTIFALWSFAWFQPISDE